MLILCGKPGGAEAAYDCGVMCGRFASRRSDCPSGKPSRLCGDVAFGGGTEACPGRRGVSKPEQIKLSAATAPAPETFTLADFRLHSSLLTLQPINTLTNMNGLN